VCPARTNASSTAEPMYPLPPVRKIRIQYPLPASSLRS
jgi:hypothetical protein